MINTVRTTIRIRKDLFDQSRLLAFQRNTSLQEVINDTLIKGFRHTTNINPHKEAMAVIDGLAKKMRGKKINVQQLIDENKKQLEERTNRLLDSALHE
ncbi:MAG: hypothetical protein HY425_03630 [Candidatus Levybacteria bacterium]|nr:hypothetical protein [Candidatus Levybacteria bacterium]